MKAGKDTIKYPVFMGKFPKEVQDYFYHQGMDWNKALVAMTSDLSKDGVYCDCYLVLTDESVYYTEGSYEILLEHGPFHLRRTKAARYSAREWTVIPIREISDPETEMLVSTGRVVYNRNGEPSELCGFSSTYLHDASVFCHAISSLNEKGSLDENLLKEETVDYKVCPKCGNRFPEKGRRYCPHCLEKSSLAKRMFRMFLQYKWAIATVFLTFLLSIALSTITPYISNSVLYSDVLSPAGKWAGQIVRLVLVLIAARILTLIINLFSGILNAKVAADVTYNLKKNIFQSLNRLSYSFYTNRQTGSLMTQINSDSSTIYSFFCDGFTSLVTQMIQLIVLFVVMLQMNWKLTLLTFFTVPLFFFSFQAISHLFEKLYARSWSRRASYNSLISDVINGMRVVKAFSKEETEIRRFAQRNTASADAEMQVSYTGSRIFPFLQFLLKFGTYIVWFVGGYYILSGTGEMDYAQLMTFTAYFSMVYSPIEMLSDVTNWWSDSLNAMKRLFDIQDAKVEVTESPNAIDKEIEGRLEFRDVSFSYVENRKVLKGISFQVNAGETLGIVGKTGAGKSTIANLITRLYDCKEGEILIDGINVKDLSFDCLHRNIAIVSQETYLFAGTILENIRYAKPEATLEEVIQVSKAAHAHDFIVKYQDAYQTMVGQGGKQLSGGERQRISIARALLKDPKILILDEATSAMDTQTERSIQHALTELTRNRTTIIIAHRLSTLRDADHLISIEDGMVAESGTASELMEKKGVYYKLYTLQAEALRNVGIAVDEPAGEEKPRFRK